MNGAAGEIPRRVSPPRISVVLAFDEERDRGSRCLASACVALPGWAEALVSADRGEPVVAAYFPCEGFLHARMVADGSALRIVPEARYQHACEDSLRDLCGRWYVTGRMIGATRAELSEWTPRQRLRHLGQQLRRLPLTPIKQLPEVARRHPDGRRLVRANIHVGVLWCWLMGLGDLVGTALGAHGVDARVRHYALNGSRRDAMVRRDRAASGRPWP